jgi:geranylgeranyl pyrophosphate synthase
MAINTIATREIFSLPISTESLSTIINDYFDSFIRVCQGQDLDLKKNISTIEEYQENVKLKTVKAYEFAAVLGARISSSDTQEIYKSSKCGIHLGWMTQILDDIEALWFPIIDKSIIKEKATFPILVGLKKDHPNAKILAKLCQLQEPKRLQICSLLDEMNIRTQLLHLALDHRDKAIESLNGSISLEGSALLKIWLDWYLRDGARILAANVD